MSDAPVAIVTIDVTMFPNTLNLSPTITNEVHHTYDEPELPDGDEVSY